MEKTLTRPSLRAAINAMCRQCVYDPLAKGSCLQQIIECAIADCPLYPLRRQRKSRVSGDPSIEGMSRQATRQSGLNEVPVDSGDGLRGEG